MDGGQNVERVIVVCGATGKQGGAVARSLLERGFRVRALTRDPQKPEAQALADQGSEVVQGDMEDRSDVDQVLVEGIYGVFSVQNFWETGYDREVQQGKTVADAAKAAGVEHFIYSSVGSAHRQTGIPTSRASGRSRSMYARSDFLPRFSDPPSSCRTGSGRAR